MSEYMMVQAPTIYPQACVFCGGTKAPLVDTFREVAGGGRGYVCATCAKRIALALGLIKGERMNQLLNHGELLDAAEKALADREALVEKQMADLATQSRKIEALEELLQQERDRASTHRHLAEMIQESSKQLLSGVA